MQDGRLEHAGPSKIAGFAVFGNIAVGATILVYAQLWTQVDEASADASEASAYRVQKAGIGKRKGIPVRHLEVDAELKDDKGRPIRG